MLVAGGGGEVWKRGWIEAKVFVAKRRSLPKVLGIPKTVLKAFRGVTA